MKATFRGRRLLGALTIVLAGCGGQVEGDGGDSESAEPTGEEEGGSGGEPSDVEPGELVLDDCELGFRPDESQAPCNWLAKERCYETKTAACECICPLDGPSLCLSDFYGGDDSQTRVSCR